MTAEKDVQLARKRGRGGEVIWAMPERKHSFFQEVFPYRTHLKTQITRSPDIWKETQLNTILIRVKVRKGFAQLAIRLFSTKCDGCDFFLAPCHPIAKHIDLQHGGIMLGWFYIDLLVFEANPAQIVPRQNTDRPAQNTDRLNARGKGNHPQGTYHIETRLLM